MRYLYQSILGLSLLFPSFAYAVAFYADVLYWQPSESVDWALTNSNISSSVQPNQEISYKTIRFDFAPGFRVGGSLDKDDWGVRVLYTRYNTETEASTSGNVISTFMPSKFNTKFYRFGHVNFAIDFNMLDVDLSKRIQIIEALDFNPLIGLRAGAINQQIDTQYQDPINLPSAVFNPNNVLEKVSNNFSGFGPKVGVNSRWHFYKRANLQYSLVGDFAASYMWGKWSINDTLYQDNVAAIGGLNVGKRDFGAFSVQALVGINVEYKKYALKVGYEVSDWFNQYQVFDNGSGTHTNDLVLQGLTVAFNYYP